MLFSPRRSVVFLEGRRLICRPVTLHTVELALGMFSAEIAPVARAYYQDGADPGADPIGALIPLFCQDARGAALLDTCVELWGGAPGELVAILAGRPDWQAELAREVADLTEWSPILGGLGLEAACSEESHETDQTGPSGLHPIDVAVCGLSRLHGCAPMEVYDWPAHAFFAAVQILPFGSAPETEPALSAETSADDLRAAGFAVEG